ncbi:MAG: BMP family ABC transporter substrate-binding protein [Kosmotogaceae bacterium]
MRKVLLVTLSLALVITVGFSYTAALMITGEVGGNPIYEMMVAGAEEAAREMGFDLKVVEGGYNAAKWEPNLISLASTGKYDLIITFTEGMPNSVAKVARMFPNQNLALVDGLVTESIPNVFSLGFNDEEMAYLAGYFAGMITQSNLERANPELKVGLLAGDIYPAMTDRMRPAYIAGAKAVNPEIELVFSAAGTWSDPNKGQELAQAQFEQGVDVLHIIAGGTGVGAINKAAEMNKYIIGVDSNIIHFDPDTILACTLKYADKAIKNLLIRDYKGELNYGTYERWGIKEGVIDFTFEDPNYFENVPAEIKEKMRLLFAKLYCGEIDILE